jgi:hypothetical protein
VLKLFKLHAIRMLSEKVIYKGINILPVSLPFAYQLNPCQLAFIAVAKTDAVSVALHPDGYVSEEMSHEVGVQNSLAAQIEDFEDEVAPLIKTPI